jgi:hypothetical protein
MWGVTVGVKRIQCPEVFVLILTAQLCISYSQVTANPVLLPLCLSCLCIPVLHTLQPYDGSEESTKDAVEFGLQYTTWMYASILANLLIGVSRHC